jgi:hypothetical protein
MYPDKLNVDGILNVRIPFLSEAEPPVSPKTTNNSGYDGRNGLRDGRKVLPPF